MITLFCRLLCFTGLPQLAAWCNRKRVLILGYHSVTRGAPENPFQLHLQESLFKEHVRHLKRFYHVISLSEYLAARKNNQALPPYSVILTFDDGYRNFLTVTAPVLSDSAMPATVFLITEQVSDRGPVNSNREWNPTDDAVSLSWEEVACLCKNGVEFGSHTCTHPRLDGLSRDEVFREVSQSWSTLSRNLGIGNIAFAYPYGVWTEEVKSLVNEAGYSCALTCISGFVDFDSDLHALERTLIGNESSFAFRVHITGLRPLLRKIPLSIGRSLVRFFRNNAALS